MQDWLPEQTKKVQSEINRKSESFMGEFIAHPVVKVESTVNQKVKLKCACMTKKNTMPD